MQQDPQQPYSQGNIPPNSYPQQPNGQGRSNLRATLQRRVQIPIWAVLTSGLLLLCMLCGLLTQTTKGGSTATGTTANTSSGSSGQVSATATPRATNTPAPAPTATATAKPKAWVTVQHFSGSQNTQTPTFHLPNGSRIVWKATPTDTNANILSIELDQTDGTPIDLVANTANMSSPQSSTYNVHGDNDVYLKITTDSVNYDVQVQEYK